MSAPASQAPAAIIAEAWVRHSMEPRNEPNDHDLANAVAALDALTEAGYTLMRNLNTHPDPSLCSFCGCEVSAEGACPWCD